MNEPKTAAELRQAAREEQNKNITVTGNNPIEEKEEEIEEEEKEEENEEEVEGEDKKENEEVEEKEEEKEEETEEEKKEVETKSIEKLERTIARLMKRIDKTSGSNNELKKLLADAQAKLEEKVEDGTATLTQDDVNKEAERLANEKVLQKEFTQACNKLADEAQKVLKLKDKEFDKKVSDLTGDIGPFPSQMIGILDDLDNGGAVLAHLINDPDEAEVVYALSLPKMAARLTRLSLKLETEAKPKVKSISKVPEPKEEVGGNRATPTILHDKMTDKEWIDARNRQVAERKAQKLASLR